jgi:hypothetical protein
MRKSIHITHLLTIARLRHNQWKSTACKSQFTRSFLARTIGATSNLSRISSSTRKAFLVDEEMRERFEVAPIVRAKKLRVN